MKIRIILLAAAIFSTTLLSAQLAIAKMTGKKADKFKIGYGLFAFYDFPSGSQITVFVVS